MEMYMQTVRRNELKCIIVNAINYIFAKYHVTSDNNK